MAPDLYMILFLEGAYWCFFGLIELIQYEIRSLFMLLLYFEIILYYSSTSIIYVYSSPTSILL